MISLKRAWGFSLRRVSCKLKTIFVQIYDQYMKHNHTFHYIIIATGPEPWRDVYSKWTLTSCKVGTLSFSFCVNRDNAFLMFLKGWFSLYEWLLGLQLTLFGSPPPQLWLQSTANADSAISREIITGLHRCKVSDFSTHKYFPANEQDYHFNRRKWCSISLDKYWICHVWHFLRLLVAVFGVDSNVCGLIPQLLRIT